MSSLWEKQNRWNGLHRSPIGQKRRASERAETRVYGPALEELLHLHRLDFWHDTISQRSQPGWPDYTIFGDGWHAWLELKVRSPLTGRRGKVSDAQRRYQASIERGGGEWVSFVLPDDYDELDAWLNLKTGHSIHTDGRLRSPRKEE